MNGLAKQEPCAISIEMKGMARDKLFVMQHFLKRTGAENEKMNRNRSHFATLSDKNAHLNGEFSKRMPEILHIA